MKEKLIDDIKVDIKTYITELEINEKLPRNDSTILSETHDQKWYDARIKSLETELARKYDIIYNMSKIFHNINLQNASCKARLPWQLGDSDKSLVVLEDIFSCDNKDKTSNKKNQPIDVRTKYKEHFYKDHFVKIKDIPIDDLIEINSENNNKLNPKDSLKDSETKN